MSTFTYSRTISTDNPKVFQPSIAFKKLSQIVENFLESNLSWWIYNRSHASQKRGKMGNKCRFLVDINFQKNSDFWYICHVMLWYIWSNIDVTNVWGDSSTCKSILRSRSRISICQTALSSVEFPITKSDKMFKS